MSSGSAVFRFKFNEFKKYINNLVRFSMSYNWTVLLNILNSHIYGTSVPTSAPLCGDTMQPAEIAILLDSTHSIQRDNWPVMKQFVKDLTDRVNCGPNGVG